MASNVAVGLQAFDDNQNLDQCISEANGSGYGFIVTPIAKPSFRRVLNVDGQMSQEHHERWKNQPFFDVDDLAIRSATWSSKIIGLLSSWIHLDSMHEDIRLCSEIAFKQEIQWATHIGLTGVLLHGLPRNGLANTARVVGSSISCMPNTSLIVRVPIVDTRQPDANMGWKRWNEFRTLIGYNPRVGIALELTPQLPQDELLLKMWLAEPVVLVIVPVGIFVPNKKGHPVLTKPIQNLLKMLMHKMGVHVLVAKPSTTQHPPSAYSSYIQYLARGLAESIQIERSSLVLYDVPRPPTQPMTQNENDQAYQALETDVVKYELYKQAIHQALLDCPQQKLVTIVVVGAGKGPLVDCCLSASKVTEIPIRVFAIEKNPQVHVTLQEQKETTWKDSDVEIVLSDRNTSEKCDILVSESLGALGDNQLLKPNGICIPASHSTYICPLSSSHIYSLTQNKAQNETPHLVKLRKACELAESQRLWTFIHPDGKPSCHSRYGQIEFKVSQDAVMHSFAGYFECVLYKDIILSTRPETKTPNLSNYDTFYFPLKRPVQIQAGSTILARFWRLVEAEKQTWYEWTVSVEANDQVESLPIHNMGGRSFSMVHH